MLGAAGGFAEACAPVSELKRRTLICHGHVGHCKLRRAHAPETACIALLSLLTMELLLQGGYRAMNRMGIEASASPFLKVTFETAATFLMDATLKGQKDDLASPASRIVAGRVVDVGTGCMELIQQLKLEE